MGAWNAWRRGYIAGGACQEQGRPWGPPVCESEAMSTPDRTGALVGRAGPVSRWLANGFRFWLGLKLLDLSEISFADLAWRVLLVWPAQFELGLPRQWSSTSLVRHDCPGAMMLTCHGSDVQ